MTEKSYTPQKQSFIDWHAFSYTIGMSYKVGDIVEGERVAKTGKYYCVLGWIEEDVEFEGFETHSLAAAKRCAKKVNKTGCCGIREYECCFNEYGEMIQHLDDCAAIFEHFTTGFHRVPMD